MRKRYRTQSVLISFIKGILQRGSPDMDGVPGVTQVSIDRHNVCQLPKRVFTDLTL